MAKKKTIKSKKRENSSNSKAMQEFADGKNHIEAEADHARNLESILSRSKRNPFAADTIEAFESNLANMQIAQMQEIAVKAGVFPSGTKLTLKNKLIKAFKQYTQGSMRSIQVTKPLVEPGSEKEKKLLNILKK